MSKDTAQQTKKGISAGQFRLVMWVVLALIVGGIVAVSFFGISCLNQKSTEVSAAVYEATIASDKLNNIRVLAKKIEENRDIAQSAHDIVAESQSYQYQDVIIRDINSIAASSDVRVESYVFRDGSESGAASRAPAQSAPNQAPTTPPAPQTAPTTAVKSTTADITIANPIDYQKLLNFMRAIEQNPTKMQLQEVNITKGKDGTKTVTNTVLTIEVYIR